MDYIEFKSPSATLDYQVDYDAWLDTDEIASSTWTVSSGITKDSDTNTTTTTTIWLSGGTAHAVYTCTNVIVTSGGRTEERKLTIFCGNGYASLIELKQEIDLSGAGDDNVLYRLLLTAEMAINNYCGRPDGFLADSAATARYFAGDGGQVLRIDECVEITEVAVKESSSDTSFTAWDTPTTNWAGDGDWFAFSGDRKRPNFNPIVEGKPYTGLQTDPNGDYVSFTSGRYRGISGFRPLARGPRSVFTVKVTAKWGYATTVPSPITQATVMMVARWYKRLETQMGDALANADMGEVRYTKKLDPDIEFLLRNGRYKRPTVARI